MGFKDWFRSNRPSSTNSLSGDGDPDAEVGSSPGFTGSPLESMPRARDSGDPRATSHYRLSGCCLPLG
jgi:hypothetical protein